MVYPYGSYHLVHRHQAQGMKKKKLSKLEKILRTLPSPGVDQTFDYCLDCNRYQHLRFRKLFLGNIEVSTSCCGKVLGYLDFPHGMTRKDRKIYVAWLNH